MNYKEFIKNINFGNYTAFVYDSPKSRMLYSSGEITDDVFAYTDSNTEFRIEKLDDYDLVKKVIIANFLLDLKPAAGIIDEDYEEVKRYIEQGKAMLGIWEEEIESPYEYNTTYMLIL